MEKVIPYILSAWLIIGLTFLAPVKVFSQTDTQQITSPPVKGITPGRARALAGTAVCLLSLGIGWWAKKRATGGTGNGRTSAVIALLLGITGIVLSGIHLVITAGAVFGSGSGKAGAIVGLVLGLIGISLGGLALRSSKVR
jgi:Family of unknown function (DUF6223)